MFIHFSAGNLKTDTEIEELLESGNFAVFTQGVSHSFIYITSNNVFRMPEKHRIKKLSSDKM